VKDDAIQQFEEIGGNELVRFLSALSSPHRLRILAALAGGRTDVSQLAREVHLSRPLVHMHLQRLAAAGLVSGRLELSEEGKAKVLRGDALRAHAHARARRAGGCNPQRRRRGGVDVILAATEWPEAAIAIAGIAFVTIVVSVAVWQIFSTGRTAISKRSEETYRKLAEETADLQRRNTDVLERAVAELGEIRRRTTELERVLKEVE
jgi:DNA-binding transcriptional ArsR family regulator